MWWSIQGLVQFLYTFGSLSLPSIVVAVGPAAVAVLLSLSFAPVAVVNGSPLLSLASFLPASFSLKRFKMATAKAGRRLAFLPAGASWSLPLWPKSSDPMPAPAPAPAPAPVVVAVVVAVAVEVEVAFMSALSVSLLFLVSIVVKGLPFRCCCNYYY